MHKWFTKLTVVGILGLVVTAIFAATASARVYISGDTQTQVSLKASDSAAVAGGGTVSLPGHMYAKGTQVAPAVGTPESGPPAQHVQKSTVTSSYSSFPEVARTMNLGKVAPAPANDNGFTWSDAGIGAAIGIGVLLVLGLFSVGIRRSKATPAHA
jgi:hypothetical protein